MKKTKEEIVQLAEEMSKTPAEMVEWRIDFFQEKDNLEKIKECLIPVRKILKDKQLLLTMRIQSEGGSVTWNQVNLPEYLEFLIQHTPLYDAIDLEMQTIKMIRNKEKEHLIAILKINHKLFIGSYHNFHHMEDADIILKKCKEIGDVPVDIVKIAYLPNTIKEVEGFIQLSKQVDLPTNTKKVMIAMSDLGREMRIWPEKTKSAIAYCSYQKETTLGQITIAEYIKIREHQENQ